MNKLWFQRWAQQIMNTIQGEVIIPINTNNSEMSDLQEQRK